VFFQDGQPYRQINASGQASYDKLMERLYGKLTEAGLLIKHVEVSAEGTAGAYKVIRPEPVPFVSYPYEWSFSQLKDAAVTTLKIQNLALEGGMTLVDASAYNLQFVDGKPVFIDTLSFEDYKEGEPWAAYRQFCQHFVAPLALMAKVDLDLSRLLQTHIDGIPIPLAYRLLPWQTKMRPGVAMHLGLHSRMQQERSSSAQKQAASVSLTALRGIMSSLLNLVESFKLPDQKTVWGTYYSETNYSDASFAEKGKLLESFLTEVQPGRVVDLGANTGVFSRIAGKQTIGLVVSADVDPVAVEKNYLDVKRNGENNILPLLIDLTSPSPALGWANQERLSFGERAKADAVVALALVHHLAIGNNLPLARIAQYLAELAPHLVIEFVPKEDSQTQKLLLNRPDIFDDYTTAGFEQAFGQLYETRRKEPIKNTHRVLYLMQRRES
jgi:ribosomal protein L11 methylase PrmA